MIRVLLAALSAAAVIILIPVKKRLNNQIKATAAR